MFTSLYWTYKDLSSVTFYPEGPPKTGLELEKVTDLTAKQSQTSRPDMNRVLILGFVFKGEVSLIGEVSPLIPRDKITAMTAT